MVLWTRTHTEKFLRTLAMILWPWCPKQVGVQSRGGQTHLLQTPFLHYRESRMLSIVPLAGYAVKQYFLGGRIEGSLSMPGCMHGCGICVAECMHPVINCIAKEGIRHDTPMNKNKPTKSIRIPKSPTTLPQFLLPCPTNTQGPPLEKQKDQCTTKQSGREDAQRRASCHSPYLQLQRGVKTGSGTGTSAV